LTNCTAIAPDQIKCGGGCGLRGQLKIVKCLVKACDRITDATQWSYDAPTGLLTRKTYADNSHVDYAYTADGKLASRTWARGVTTSYDYNAAGDLVSIDYSDSTPDVRFTYDRLGRVLSATNSAAAYFYAYDAFGRLTNEVGPYATLARHYDELGRPIGYDLLDGYTGTLSRVRYEYAADGRFAAVVWTNRGESTGYRADYSYLAGSGLLAALTNSSGLTWTRSYEAHRDLLSAVENRNGTNLLSRYDYANDALGRRTARLDSFEFPVSSKIPLTTTNVRS
jgi:YD repeat-containing protein